MALSLSIVTPERAALEVQCDEVTAPGINGDIGLLPGHIPVVTALRPGVLLVFSDGKRSAYAISTGFAEMEGDKVTVLTDNFEPAGSVDVARARSQVEKAEAELAGLSEADPRHSVEQMRLRRALARLDAAEMK